MSTPDRTATLFQLFRRAPGLSCAEFQEHWLECHARHGREDPSVLRYTQFHRLLHDPYGDAVPFRPQSRTPAYDGVAALSYENVAAAHRAMASEAFLRARDNEPVFVDPSRSTQVLMREHVMIPQHGDGPIAVVECLTSRPGLDCARFNEIWDDHSRMALSLASYMTGYVQWRLVSGELQDPAIPGLRPDAERWDGIATASFRSIATFKALGRIASGSSDEIDDELRFLDLTRMVAMLTRRHVIKA